MKNKRILIFGGTGSLGTTIVKRFVDDNAVLVFSRGEMEQWKMRSQMSRHPNLEFMIGDIRDLKRVKETTQFVPSVVIVAAALKQVPVCEKFPGESIKTNVLGIQNIVDVYSRIPCCLIYISSDKAVFPINVYGLSKALAEKVVIAASNNAVAKMIVVRYGNVLNSRGSILPLFVSQGKGTGPITLTHKDMTRFVMTIDQSVDLILKSLYGKNGEIWIPKLRSMRVLDLAELFSEKYNKIIQEIGKFEGEKFHECLIGEIENTKVITKHGCLVVTRTQVNDNLQEYRSNQDLMNKDELKELLISGGFL